MFYGQSQNSYFLTMLKVKIGHILPKWKKENPNFLYIVKYVKIYQEIDKKLEKCDGQIDSFLPWTQI